MNDEMHNPIQRDNVNIKKILFYISIVPYVIFFTWGIFHFILSSIENNYYDMHVLIEPLANYKFYLMVRPNVILLILTIFCMCYPILYLLDKNYNHKGIEIYVGKSNKKTLDIPFILYMISFIPYLYLLYLCISDIEFLFSVVIRFKVLVLATLWGTFMPIYPLILVFQIIYTIKRFKTFSSKTKLAVSIPTAFIILLILIPSMIYPHIK